MVHGEHVERHHLDETLWRKGDRRDLQQGAQLFQHESGARQKGFHAGDDKNAIVYILIVIRLVY